MLEVQNKVVETALSSANKAAYIYLRSRLYLLTGNWEWELHSDQLFCSDVMFSAEGTDAIAGTRCLIHPDDVSKMQVLVDMPGVCEDFRFRVITSYGTLVVVSCKGQPGCVEEEGFSQTLFSQSLKNYTAQKVSQEVSDRNALLLRAWQQAGKLCSTGVWYYNSSTYETHYSDEIYRLHGLPPESLNAHLQTFDHLIHPEDLDAVSNARDLSYRHQLPLQLEYRILLNETEIRLIAFSTCWTFSNSGENILLGVMTDITGARHRENDMDVLVQNLKMNEQVLRHAETMGRMASWSMDLQTRKTSYSEQIYRIYGLRSSELPLNPSTLGKYVHPEDQAFMAEINLQILDEHVVPDVEYRIIRPDGKLRYLRQKGKIVMSTGGEMLVIGTIMDITDLENAERKLLQVKADLSLQQFIYGQQEEFTGIGSWIADLDSGEISWSRGIYELAGLKQGTIQLSQKILMNLVHQDDRDLFSEEMARIRDSHSETEFEFRMRSRNETRYIRAVFRRMLFDEKNIFFATFQDKTAEVLLRKQLYDEESLIETLSDASHDRVIVTDTNNCIIHLNRKCEEDFELKKEKVAGLNLFEVLPKLKTSSIISRFQQAFNGELVQVRDEHSLLSTGYQHMLLVPLKNPEHKVVSVLTILHDATFEFEIRRQLSERQHLIEKLLDATADRMMVLDRHMNYLYWNRQAEKYYGIRREEVIGRNILELFPGMMDDPSYASFRKAMRGEVIHIPGKKETAGPGIPFDTHLIPVRGDGGQVMGVLWIVHDRIIEFNLDQQKSKTMHILQFMKESFIELDLQGRICSVNDAAGAFLEKNAGILEGSLLQELLGPDSALCTVMDQVKKLKKELCGEYFDPFSQSQLFILANLIDDHVILLFYKV